MLCHENIPQARGGTQGNLEDNSLLLPAGLRVAQPMPVLFLLSGPKMGRHVAPINVDQVRSAVPNFTFIGAKMWEYSPQNCQNFEFWPEICISGATRYEILSVCTRL